MLFILFHFETYDFGKLDNAIRFAASHIKNLKVCVLRIKHEQIRAYHIINIHEITALLSIFIRRWRFVEVIIKGKDTTSTTIGIIKRLARSLNN